MESYRILTIFNAMNFENFNNLAFSISNFLVGTGIGLFFSYKLFCFTRGSVTV
jgi:hypothetical protein